jgi:hypothetical protein
LPGTISTMTAPLGVVSRRSNKGGSALPISTAGPIVITVSPSQSGMQLTATHDGVDQVWGEPSIPGRSSVAESRMNKSEFGTGTCIDAIFITPSSIVGYPSALPLTARYTVRKWPVADRLGFGR